MGTGRPEVRVGVGWASTQLSRGAWLLGDPACSSAGSPSLAHPGNLAARFLMATLLFPCRIGGEKVILLSASAWGFITVATPLLAHLGSAHLAFMTFSRILTGLLQGRGPKRSRARECVHM